MELRTKTEVYTLTLPISIDSEPVTGRLVQIVLSLLDLCAKHDNTDVRYVVDSLILTLLGLYGRREDM